MVRCFRIIGFFNESGHVSLWKLYAMKTMITRLEHQVYVQVSVYCINILWLG
jgi:hypothetical protein